MRLSDVLSKDPADDFEQVEGFLYGEKFTKGIQKKIEVGEVILSFFCPDCEKTFNFLSRPRLFCIYINDNLISIDCSLICLRCKLKSVPVWFLVSSYEKIHSSSPKIRILKRSFRLPNGVLHQENFSGEFEEMLNKADIAYAEGLGAGSIIYLRQILEKITKEVAKIAGVSELGTKGGPKPFRNFLEEVDVAKPFIPQEFSQNAYKLFGELSEVTHGNLDEQLALEKYSALKRLVKGVLENAKNNQEMLGAIEKLGWNNKG